MCKLTVSSGFRVSNVEVILSGLNLFCLVRVMKKVCRSSLLMKSVITLFHVSTIMETMLKVKVKFHPLTCHEDTEGE